MIGKELKLLRLLHNVKTQTKCAELLGVTERTIASLETSGELINDKMMREIRAVFDVEKYETQIKGQFTDLSNY